MVQASSTDRPILLSILCGLGFAGCFFRMIVVISPTVQAQGRLYAAYVTLSTLVFIACLTGLWLLKRWAAWSLLAYTLIDLAIHGWMGYWDTLSSLLKVFLVVIGFLYYRRLKR